MQTSSPPAIDDNSKNTFFFDNQARAALRHEIMAALVDGAPFLVLTGPGGSGKTTLISRLVATLPNGIEGIMISQTSHGGRRFDDVLLHLCRHIALEPAWHGHPDAEQIQRIQEGIRDYLTRSGTRLLLILDQGEQVFLAMLERVRKMMNAVNVGSVVMYLLVVGQENLLSDLKRLRLADWQEIAERYFVLPLLDEDDLPDFLRQWLTDIRPDIPEDAISQRDQHMLYAEAAGRPGRMAMLIREKIDILTDNKAERHSPALVKAAKAKFSAVPREQSMSAGFSPTALAWRLQDALLAPPLLAKFRPKRPATRKRRRGTPHFMANRRAYRTRLRRKNIVFWGKLYRLGQRLRQRFFYRFMHDTRNLRKRIKPAMAGIFHGSIHVIGKLRRRIAQATRAVFSAVSNRPWAKTRQLPSHRPASLARTIAATCATALATFTQGCRRLSPTTDQVGLRKAAEITASLPGILKKSAALLVAVCLVAAVVTVLWQGLFRSPSPERNKHNEAPALTAKDSPPPEAASFGAMDILPVEKPTNQIKPERTEEKPRNASMTAARMPIAIAPEAAITMTGKKSERPAHTRGVVKINARKVKKKVAPAASKPILIPRSKVVEKIRR